MSHGPVRRMRGIAAYARIFDVPESEVPATFARRVGPTFAEEAIGAAGGPVWSDGALNDRDRSVAILTAMTAQGVTGDRLRTHIALAQQNGLGEDSLTALMTLLAAYLGYPKASMGMETVTDMFADPPSGSIG